MNKKVPILFLSGMMLSTFAFSQKITQQVISSGGMSTTSSSSTTLDATIGEPVISTLSQNQVILTQGFHQTKFEVVSVTEPSVTSLFKLKTYPNPVSTQLFIENQTTQIPLEVFVYDNNGRLILNEQFDQKRIELNTSTWAQQTYLIQVTDQKTTQTFKIIKSTSK